EPKMTPARHSVRPPPIPIAPTDARRTRGGVRWASDYVVPPRAPAVQVRGRSCTRTKSRVCDDFGAVRLDELTSKDVRRLVRRLKASGASGQSVRNAVVSLQALY